MKKKLIMLLLMIVTSLSMVSVKASNITLDTLESDIKKSSTYKSLSTDETKVEITHSNNELQMKYTSNNEVREHVTNFDYKNGVLSYKYVKSDLEDESGIIFLDTLWVTQIVHSVASLNGYDENKLESLSYEAIKSYTLENNGLKIETFKYKREYEDGSFVTTDGISTFEIDLNKFKIDGLEKTPTGTVDNPKTGSTFHVFMIVILIMGSLGAFFFINKTNAFKNFS